MQVAVLEFDVDSVDDEWESLVAAGQTIVEAHEKNRWSLGDLAIKAERRYGDEALKKFAHAINVRPSTMYDYHRVAKFYPPPARATFAALSWSHYREAKKLEDFNTAMSMLRNAANWEWPVAELAKAVDKALGNPVKPAVKSWPVDYCDGNESYLTLRTNDADAIAAFVTAHSQDADFALELRATYTPKAGTP